MSNLRDFTFQSVKSEENIIQIMYLCQQTIIGISYYWMWPSLKSSNFYPQKREKIIDSEKRVFSKNIPKMNLFKDPKPEFEQKQALYTFLLRKNS